MEKNERLEKRLPFTSKHDLLADFQKQVLKVICKMAANGGMLL